MNKDNLIIGVDFDGTCVTHKFPEVGLDIGARNILRSLVDRGHRLILFTMRSNNKERNYLDEAVQWFKDNDIPLYGINENPEQHKWTSSPKPYCHIYIDDAALGCPLESGFSNRDYVDWQKVEWMLGIQGVLGPEFTRYNPFRED